MSHQAGAPKKRHECETLTRGLRLRSAVPSRALLKQTEQVTKTLVDAVAASAEALKVTIVRLVCLCGGLEQGESVACVQGAVER